MTVVQYIISNACLWFATMPSFTHAWLHQSSWPKGYNNRSFNIYKCQKIHNYNKSVLKWKSKKSMNHSVQTLMLNCKNMLESSSIWVITEILFRGTHILQIIITKEFFLHLTQKSVFNTIDLPLYSWHISEPWKIKSQTCTPLTSKAQHKCLMLTLSISWSA